MVLDQLIDFFWVSVSSSVNTIHIELYWYYLLTEGQRDVYVLHSKVRQMGLFWIESACVGVRPFVSYISPIGSSNLLYLPSRNLESLMMVMNMTPLNKATFNTEETWGKKQKKNLDSISQATS